MSLRARLIIGVVALAAVGLLVAGATTYIVQRNFQFSRIDQQATAALPVVVNQLEDGGVVEHVDALDPRDPSIGFGNRPPRGGRDRGRGPGGNLPSAVYGEARDAAGKVLGHVTPGLPPGETAPAAPKLPADLEPGEPITRSACAASSRTPRTSCARRCRRSAATPSCFGSAPRRSPRTSRRR